MPGQPRLLFEGRTKPFNSIKKVKLKNGEINRFYSLFPVCVYVTVKEI
jgi:hypothetical protein